MKPKKKEKYSFALPRQTNLKAQDSKETRGQKKKKTNTFVFWFLRLYRPFCFPAGAKYTHSSTFWRNYKRDNTATVPQQWRYPYIGRQPGIRRSKLLGATVNRELHS